MEFKNLPSVEAVLEDSRVKIAAEEFTHQWTVDIIRKVIAELRQKIKTGMEITADPFCWVSRKVLQELQNPDLNRFCRVINATGIIIHTNLGRAPLAESARKSILDTAKGYSNLEYDLLTGKRGTRHSHIGFLLCHLTGAEDVHICNNNAAAVMLCLNTIAEGKEVVVSRGELVEIGGSFRMPEIMAKSHCKMVEIGTTNRTHLKDYAAAITDDTALILKIHTSNYRIRGFVASVDLKELVRLGRQHAIPVMEDQGSGNLIDFFPKEIQEREHLVKESIQMGTDIVTFSGDKLLGGPQAGLIAGSSSLIGNIRSNPLARALRIDKLCLAGIEATLRLYIMRDSGFHKVPVVRMMRTPQRTLKNRAMRIVDRLRRETEGKLAAHIRRCESAAGGGSLPTVQIPSWGCVVPLARAKPVNIAQQLRNNDPPVISRIESDALVFDVRTVMTTEEKELVTATVTALRNGGEI
jgi:L-seryl-tRNA(Ser) seleniumtransferase